MQLSFAGKVGVAALTFAAALASARASDGPAFIDFERFPGPDGILGSADDVAAPSCDICFPLGTEFSSIGVTFKSGTLAQGNWFPGTATNNHYVTSTPLDATVSRLVTGISITSYSYWTATLYALDDYNNIIASDTLANPNAGLSPVLGTLKVSTGRAIRRFAVLAAGCEVGGPCDQILNLDNLSLTAPEFATASGPPGIPAIGPWGLAALLALVGGIGLTVLRARAGA